MQRLILVRHSTPELDEATPPSSWSLSESGKIAAREIARELSGFDFGTVLLTSPERKAFETACVIANHHGLFITISEGLREHERASTGFLPHTEFVSGIERLLRSSNELVFGDETADAVFLRFDAAIRVARSKAPDTDILAVTHGTAMSIYVSRVLGVDAFAFWRDLATPAAAIISGQEMRVLMGVAAKRREPAPVSDPEGGSMNHRYC